MRIVEAWGTGIPRIIKRCNEYNLPAPLFEEFGDGFKVTLFRKVSNAPGKVSNAPGKVSNAPKKVSNAPGKVSSAPEKVSSTPEKVSSAPEKVSSTFDKYIPMLKAIDVTDIFINNINSIRALWHRNSVQTGQYNGMA